MSIVAAGEDSLEWFQRFGDLPRIDYPVPPALIRGSSRTAASSPRFTDRKSMPSSLWWDSLDDRDGSTSASPAHQCASTDLGEVS